MGNVAPFFAGFSDRTLVEAVQKNGATNEGIAKQSAIFHKHFLDCIRIRARLSGGSQVRFLHSNPGEFRYEAVPGERRRGSTSRDD